MKRNQIKSAMWGRAFLTMGALILSASLALAGPHKMSRDLEERTDSDQVDVIVQFNQMPTAEHHQKVLGRGGAIRRDLSLINGGAYTMSASSLKDLAADPEVIFISPDRKIRASSTQLSKWVLDYHAETVNAPAAWAQGLDGSGIGVAVIDSGIAAVRDLDRTNLVYSQDFTGDPWGSTYDWYGHGTHVSGILAGNGHSSSFWNDFYTFNGIADNVDIVNLRVLDRNGEGTDSQVIAAIQTAIQLQSTYNIRIINLSLGRPVWESYKTDPLCQAVEQAWQSGIIVVVAAGNYGRDNDAGTNGYGTITAPGNDPYVITVGAMNTEGTADRSDDVITSYSSKGPTLFDQVVKPDIAAPGNLVISLYTPWETLSRENPGNAIPYSLYRTNGWLFRSFNYFILSGTSVATPMVSGAAALLLQQDPTLTPDQVKARLMKTSFKNLIPSSSVADPVTGQTYNDQADIFTVGAGYLDIQAALLNTDLGSSMTGSAASPTAMIDTSGNVVLVTGTPAIWDSGDVWSSTAVWGNSVFSGTNQAGQSVMWGSSSLTSASVIWTSTSPADASVMWGADVVSGSSVMWGSRRPSVRPTVMLLGDPIAP